jgi:NADPH:quinone reductase-like Zn-dependent oxidoreductase
MLALVASSSAPEHIELRDAPEPTPAPNETLVRVHAVSINRGEVNRLPLAEDGARFGWDLAGTVERPSADGNGPVRGTRVVAFVLGGAWAGLAAVPNLRLAPIPDNLSFEAAAATPVAGLTALRMVRIENLLGKRVLITGAAGGVGRFAIQLAAHGGAHVTGVVSSEARGRGLRELGAENIIFELDPSSEPYDIILESVGGKSLATVLGMVRAGGLINTFGNSSKEETTFSINRFYTHHAARLQAFSILAPNQPPDFREDLRYLAELAAAGTLDVQLDLVTDWHDAAAAFAALRERRVHGKAVLRIT